MIIPTVGRVVWYWSDVKQQAQPMAATVAYVHGDRMVNLSVVDSNGIQFAKQSVVLVQDGDVRPEREFCEWMPYQLGQAARTVSAEERLMREGKPETPRPGSGPAVAGPADGDRVVEVPRRTVTDFGEMPRVAGGVDEEPTV